jgi:SAM-dependent methyltransferase
LALVGALCSAVFLRHGLFATEDAWLYWEGSVSLLEHGHYSWLHGRPIVAQPQGFPFIWAGVQGRHADDNGPPVRMESEQIMKNWDYHGTRLVPDRKREILWKSLWRFWFSRLIAPEDTVLDIGCGHGCFINSVQARRKIAMDQWKGFVSHINPGTQTAVAGLTEIDFIEAGAVDFAFLSNVTEHVTKEDFSLFLEKLKPKLSAKGTLNLIQPNYRFCAKEYFNDFTRISVYSHVSLKGFSRCQWL